MVSGGVSLGAYQAGFLYYYTSALRIQLARGGADAGSPDGRAVRALPRIEVATGASAGAVNAFLALMEGCRSGDIPQPTESPFYKAWVPIGLRQLVSGRDKTASAVFSRSALDLSVDEVSKLWNSDAGWPLTPCLAYLGVTATRMRPRSVSYPIRITPNDPAIAVRTQNEKFVLKLELSAASRRISNARLPEENQLLSNEVFPALGNARSLTDDVALEDMVQLLKASAAFPGAFPPVAVPVTIWSPRGRTGEYDAHPQLPAFTDGGFLDNTPLKIALSMAARLPGRVAASKNVLFLKSDSVSWRQPSSSPSPPLEEKPGLLDEFFPFLAAVVAGASDEELLDTLVQYDWPNEPPKLLVPARRFPVAADHLAHFFSFLETDFRRADFYQGMADAHGFLTTLGPEAKRALDALAHLRRTSPELACILNYRARLDPKVPQAEPPVPSCPEIRASHRRNFEVILFASAKVRQQHWQRGGEHDELGTFAAALHQQHFKYNDLAAGQELDEADLRIAVREQMEVAIDGLYERQGSLSSLRTWNSRLLVEGGRVMSNYYDRRPRGSFWAIGLGSTLLDDGGVGPALALRLSWDRLPQLSFGTVAWYERTPPAWRDPAQPHLITYTYQTGLMIGPTLIWSASPTVELDLSVGLTATLRGERNVLRLIGSPISWGWGLEAGFGVVFFQRLAWSLGFTWLPQPCLGTNANLSCDYVFADYRSYPRSFKPNQLALRTSLLFRMPFLRGD